MTALLEYPNLYTVKDAHVEIKSITEVNLIIKFS